MRMKWKYTLFLVSSFFWVSCLPSANEIMNPTTDSEDEVETIDGKTKDDYFSFETSNDITLLIDYGLSDYQVDFSIYIEDPMNHNPSEENWSYYLDDVDPVLAGYTDANGYFSGTVSLPNYVDTVYLVSRSIGISPYEVIPVENNTIDFHYIFNTVETKATIQTRAEKMVSDDETYNVGTNLQKWTDATATRGAVYALFDEFEVPSYKVSTINNSKGANVYRQITSATAKIVNGSSYSALISTINDYYSTSNRLGYKVAHESYTKGLQGDMDDYYTVKTIGTDSVEIETLMYPNGNFSSAIGYYFYKSDEKMTEAAIRKLPKYIIYANSSWSTSTKALARLQYVTYTNGAMTGSSKFPPGYTVGFLELTSTSTSTGSTSYDRYKNTALDAYQRGHSSYSNLTKEQFGVDEPGSLVLYDDQNGGVFFGFEDCFSVDFSSKPNYSFNYCDPFIYVYSNPVKGIQTEPLPTPPDTPPEGMMISQHKGVLLFEDKWPHLGDYDMNDVMVGYQTIITVKEDKVISIEDIFTPIKGASAFNNAFGFVYNDNGTVDPEKSTIGILKEGEKQYIMIPNLNTLAEEGSYTLYRNVSDLNLSAYKRDYNVFIVPNYDTAPETARKEIHLPKYEMTPRGDQSLIGTEDEAWFIYKVDGNYPFSIDLSGLNRSDFVPVDEGQRIGSAGNYPFYTSWVKSEGQSDKKWYTQKNSD